LPASNVATMTAAAQGLKAQRIAGARVGAAARPDRTSYESWVIGLIAYDVPGSLTWTPTGAPEPVMEGIGRAETPTLTPRLYRG
jgi:hypothetical protein